MIKILKIVFLAMIYDFVHSYDHDLEPFYFCDLRIVSNNSMYCSTRYAGGDLA